jgi:hypothetical protein
MDNVELLENLRLNDSCLILKCFVYSFEQYKKLCT